MCLFQQRLQFLHWHNFAVDQHLQPEHGFVGFLDDDPDLRNPLGSGTRAASRPIVRRDCCSATHQLLAENLSIRFIRQSPIDTNNSDSKLFRSVSKFFLVRRHQVHKLQNYPITKLQNS